MAQRWATVPWSEGKPAAQWRGKGWNLASGQGRNKAEAKERMPGGVTKHYGKWPCRDRAEAAQVLALAPGSPVLLQDKAPKLRGLHCPQALGHDLQAQRIGLPQRFALRVTPPDGLHRAVAGI